MTTNESIFLAPLQGFTDFVYRECYHKIFGSVQEYYIPYISIGPGQKIRNSQMRDILPENNDGIPVVPQVLCGNKEELKELCNVLKDFGYQKLNLNLGCPYPMATKKGRGTGLLEDEEKLNEVLDSLFSDFSFQVSAKFRSGLESDETIFSRVDLLNAYPFERLIYHPRTAKQMYKESANRDLFVRLKAMINAPLVYNGDILCKSDVEELKSRVSDQNEWMIGQGILMNPFLPGELREIEISQKEKKEKLINFHESILQKYIDVFQDQGIVLKRMEQFWSYFYHSFEEGRKIKKAAKKAKNLNVYNQSFLSLIKA